MVFTERSLVLCTACLLITSTMAQNLHHWDFSYDEQDHSLAHATLLIIRQHISSLTSNIIMAKEVQFFEMEDEHNAVMKYLLKNLQGNVSVELDIADNSGEYFVLIVDSLFAFQDLLFQIPVTVDERFASEMKSAFEYRALHFIIVLTYETDEEEIFSIFNECVGGYVFHAIIITAFNPDPDKDVISVYSFKLYSGEICDYLEPYLLYSFDEDFESLKTIFHDKSGNLHGCPLKVIGRISPPFLNFKGNLSDPQPVGDWENLTGFEGKLLKHLSHVLNFTIELLPFTDFIECYFQVYWQKADIAIGGLSSSAKFHDMVSTSTSYYNSHLKHVVRGKVLSPLSLLALPLNRKLWALIAVILIIISVFILHLRARNQSIRHFVLGRSNNMPFINLCGILVGYAVPAPMRTFPRFCFMMFLILTLILRSAYLGAQYDAIRKHKNLAPAPLSFEQLVKQNYTLLISPNDMSSWDLYKRDRSSLIVSEDLDIDRLDILEKTEGNFASMTLRESFFYYWTQASRSGTGSQLFMIDEIFSTYYMVMVLPRTSEFLTVVNEKLRYLNYAGITSMLARELNLEKKILNDENARRSANEKFTVEHLRGIFEIYAVLVIGTIVVFGFEMLSIRSELLKRIFKWID